MQCTTDSELVKTLVAKAKRLYDSNEIPYEWDEVITLIEADPEIFTACLRRARRYKSPIKAPKSQKLWITCNLARAFMLRPECYFCGKVIKREEFLAGNAHLEHLDPRAGGGEHIPINITFACRQCNMLKKNYKEVDFDLILNDPEAFQIAHPYMAPKTFQKLSDFAEIINYRFKGNNWIFERFGISSKMFRTILDQKKSDYRRKWGIE